jgi:hypothetical protein
MRVHRLALACACGLGTVAAASAAASAEVTPPGLKVVGIVVDDSLIKEPVKVRIGERVVIQIAGLKAALEKSPASIRLGELRLHLDGQQLKGVAARDFDWQKDRVQFFIERTDADKEIWAQLLGGPSLGGEGRSIRLGVGESGKQEFLSDDAARAALKAQLIVIDPARLWLGVIGALLLLVLVFVGRGKSSFLRDNYPKKLPDAAAGEDPPRRPYSLARVQMAFWLFLVLVGFVFVWIVTGDYRGILTSQALVLMGISTATGLAAVTIDSGRPQAELDDWGASKGFFADILSTTSSGSLPLPRLQILVWTVILGAIFIYEVYTKLRLPEFDSTLLTLMGVSSGVSAGFKWPEKLRRSLGSGPSRDFPRELFRRTSSPPIPG